LAIAVEVNAATILSLWMRKYFKLRLLLTSIFVSEL
jgi:hypothetical protein